MIFLISEHIGSLLFGQEGAFNAPETAESERQGRYFWPSRKQMKMLNNDFGWAGFAVDSFATTLSRLVVDSGLRKETGHRAELTAQSKCTLKSMIEGYSSYLGSR